LIILIFSTSVIGCNNKSKDEKPIVATEKNTIKDQPENDTEPVENKTELVENKSGRVDTKIAKTESKTDQDEGNTGKADSKNKFFSEQGKYGIRSARVVTNTAMPNGMGNSVSTMYFDDYGKVSLTETVTKIVMKGAPAPAKKYNLKQGSYLYSWTEGKKAGTKMNLANMKDLSKMDFGKVGNEMMDKMNMKKAADETFLGKTCEVLEMNNEQMGKGKILSWNNIPMLSDMTIMGMKMRVEVTELEENPSIKPGMFVIPVDIEFTEMPNEMPRDLK
jgi:hypothetical protein